MHQYRDTTIPLFLLFTPQIDHCEERIKSVESLTGVADSKVDVPSESVVEAFYTVIKQSTQRNYKKRCLMDEVYADWLVWSNEVYNYYCSVSQLRSL